MDKYYDSHRKAIIKLEEAFQEERIESLTKNSSIQSEDSARVMNFITGAYPRDELNTCLSYN